MIRRSPCGCTYQDGSPREPLSMMWLCQVHYDYETATRVQYKRILIAPTWTERGAVRKVAA